MWGQKILRICPMQTIKEFHTGLSHGSIGSQSSMLKKLITGSNRSKKKFFNVTQTPEKQLLELKFLQADPGAKPKQREMSRKGIRRVNVLNTLFCEQITSILSTGDGGDEVLGLGLQISHVKITNDFTQLNVYWEPKGDENDEKLEEILPRVAKRVRHFLCDNKVFGVVPPILFVKDRFYERVAIVEKAFETCDYGPEYEPSSIGTALKKMNPISMSNKSYSKRVSIVDEVQQEVEMEERLQFSEDEIDFDDVRIDLPPEESLYGPDMRHDIMGLDHKRIMTKVIEAVKQSKKPAEREIFDVYATDTTSLRSPIEIPLTDNARTKEFLNYLKLKQYKGIKERKYMDTALERNFQDQQVSDRLADYSNSEEAEYDRIEREIQQDKEYKTLEEMDDDSHKH